MADDAEKAVAAVAEAISSPPPYEYVYSEAKEQAGITYDAFSSCAKSQLSDLIHEAAYGETSPMGQPWLASKIDNVDTSAVVGYRAANYKTGNLVVSATGIAHDKLKQYVECYFNSLPKGQGKAPAAPYVGGDIKVRADLNGETYLGLAFPTPAGEASKPYSVLYSLISTKIAAMKLPHGSLTPFYTQYSTGGLIGFRAKGAPLAASGYLEAGVAELKAAAKNATDSGKVRAAVVAMSQLEGESSANVLLSAAIAGVAPASLVDTRSVTASAVASAASAALSAAPAYAVYGATAGTPSASAIAKMIKA